MDFVKIIEDSLKSYSEVYGEDFIVDKKFIDEKFEELSKVNEKQELVSKDNNSLTLETKEISIAIKTISNKSETDFIAIMKENTPKIPEKTIPPNWYESKSLDELNQAICNCKECALGDTRNKFVFGSGNPKADIMIIGEAPGADEDEQGLPFVGRAGQLLTKILESINLSREEVYIANIIKCRPPNNRRPFAEEVQNCEPYLIKQIELINPEFILSLGLTSVDTLLKKTHKMGDIRGKVLNYQNKKMLVTYHPAALLRNPGWKKFVWEDVKLLRSMYDDYIKSKDL